MTDLNELLILPDDFSGRVRLFPLPNLVLFPGVMQPLHIFEPRYREMLEAAIATDGLIAMAVLADGWQQDYDGRPPLAPIACLGRVATHARQEDGRFNILLVGIRRVRIVRELPSEAAYREAQIEVLNDEYPEENAVARAALQRRLVSAFRKLMPQLDDVQEQLSQLLGNGVSLGALCDIIAYTLNLPIEFKLKLLEEANVDLRAIQLLNHFRGLAKPSSAASPAVKPIIAQEATEDFLPKFSLN